MARTDKGCQRLAWHADERLLERNALVAGEDRLATTDLAIAITEDGRYMFDLITVRLPFVDRSAQQLEGLHEERRDEVRLKAPGLGPLHVFANLPDAADVH